MGLIQRGGGTIRCNKCSAAMEEKTKKCPKCGGVPCHIAIFNNGKLKRYYKDISGNDFSYMTAIDQLIAMNREMRTKTFKADEWLPGALRDRKIEVAADQWLKQKKLEVDRNELSFGTYYIYSCCANQYFLNSDYKLANLDIWEIGYDEIEEFRDSLPLSLKATTRRKIMRILHAFLATARKRGPALPIFPSVKGNDAKRKFALTIEDQQAAIFKIPAEHRIIFEFEAETGIRPGEACALKIKDINFLNKTVIIQRTFTMLGKLRESDKEGHRATIPLSSHAIQLAKELVAERFPDDWLFLNPKTKKHYLQSFLCKAWKQYTGLPISHYEGTRHSFATQINEIADTKTAQTLLRHSDPRSTEKYLHRNEKYLRVALEKRTSVVDIATKKPKAQQ